MTVTLITSLLALLGIIYSVGMARKNHKERLEFEKQQELHRQKQEELARKAKEEAEARSQAMDAKLDSKFDVLVERQMELEKQFYMLNEAVTSHVLNSEVRESFDAGIDRATNGVALDVIKGNFTINTNVKSIILRWGSLMYKLAEDFHGSDTRKEDKKGDVFKRGEELLERRNIIVSEFNTFINGKFRKNLLVALEVWNSFESSTIFNKEKEDAA